MDRKLLIPSLRFFLVLAIGASLVEFILLRLLLRGGAFAPPGESLDRLFALLMTAGLAGMNFALIAIGVSVALIAILLFGRTVSQSSLAILLWLLIVVGALLPILLTPLATLLYQGLSVGVLGLLLMLHPRKQSWDFLGAVAIVAAVFTTYYYQSSLSLSALGLRIPNPNLVFSGGEVIAVAAPLLLLGGRKWRPWLVPLAALPVVGFMIASSSAIVPLAAAWTVYFTLFLPLPVYAVALGAYAYVLGDTLRTPPQRWMGLGLLLVGLGGRMFQSTYLAQLSLLGALLFILPMAALLEVPEPGRQPQAAKRSRSESPAEGGRAVQAAQGDR